MWTSFAIILGAYLLGAFPLLYVLGRLRGVDLRQEEDLHISLWRKVGHVEGAIGVAGDLAKGVIPIVVARSLDFGPGVVVGAGLAAVIGQMWSVFLKFRGEKGNSTGLAMATTLAPVASLLPLFVIILAIAIRIIPGLLKSGLPLEERLQFGSSPSNSLPLGMIIAFALWPLFCWWTGQTWIIILACLILLGLIIVKRLLTGIRADFKTSNNKKSILINRLLLDRSYL